MAPLKHEVNKQSFIFQGDGELIINLISSR